MCQSYCTLFIENIVAGKTLLDIFNLVSPNDYQKNNKLYKYFKDKYCKGKCKPLFYIEKIDETRNLLQELNHHALIRENHEKVYRIFHYIKYKIKDNPNKFILLRLLYHNQTNKTNK